MKIARGSDHAGYGLKQRVKNYIESMNHEWVDVGCDSEESCDYPDYAHALAEMVEKGEVEYGVLMCGSGNGISMAANKHKDVRAALCWNEEIAEMARQHNNANVLSLPARYVTGDEARKILEAFFNTEFEGGRHQNRVNKINIG